MDNNNLVKAEVSLQPFESQTSFEAVQRVCQMLSKSDLVPKMYQATNGTNAIANCMIAFEMASRIGASPLMVMQNMYIVHGQPAWSSKFLIATVNASGRFSPLRYDWRGTEGADDWGCRCYAYEKSDVEKKEPLYGSWIDISTAKKEGWYGKNGSKWQTIPGLMLQYRAATFWARAYAPELSMGIKTDDEVSDIVDVPYEEVTNGKPRKYEALSAETMSELSEKMSKCNTADEIDILFDALDDALKNNHFVKKLFAARKATLNVGFTGINGSKADDVAATNDSTNKPSQQSLL